MHFLAFWLGSLFLIVLSNQQSIQVSASPFVAEPKNESSWIAHHKRLVNQSHTHSESILGIFLGASTMENWLHNGKSVWQKHFESRHVYNYGIGGDRTEHVLWRIENGEFDHLKNLRVVVVCVGHNNAAKNDHAADVAKGTWAIVKALNIKVSHAKVLLLSILPAGSGTKKNQLIHRINKLVAESYSNNSSHVHYLDVSKPFETDSVHLKTSLYVHDQIHLTPQGYQVFYEAIQKAFDSLFEKKNHLVQKEMA